MDNEDHMLYIDGSVLEGGGQILRMSVALSAITGIPVRLSNIRLGRSRPGLAAQHLKGIQLVATMCRGKVQGAEIGSTELKFVPGKIRGGYYAADILTAGATSLLLQVSLPFALLADSQVILDLKGGTNADMAPQIDYMTEVFRPQLEKFGGTFDLDLHRRGYYPKGGGHVTVTVNPVKHFNCVNLVDSGTVEKIFGWSFVAGSLPMQITQSMADGAKTELRKLKTKSPINIDCYKETKDMAPDVGSGIILVCETSTGCVLGGTGLGRRNNTPVSKIGVVAAREMLEDLNTGACLDRYAQDQIILYMALAKGKSTIKVGEVTLHTKTAIYIAEKFTNVNFEITSNESTNLIECVGIGYENNDIR